MRIFNRYPVLKTVLVNTKTGSTFSGVLWQKRLGFLVLKNARMLRRDKEPMAMDGEVVVLADNVDFIQVIKAVNG